MEKLCPAILGIITLVLLCAGAFSPGWIAIGDTTSLRGIEGHDTSGSVDVHMGLYYLVVVGKNFTTAVGYKEVSGFSVLGLGFLEYQIETILGMVLCFISVILTFIYKKEGTNGVLVAIIIMYIIAGISTVVAVGRWLSGVILISTYTNLKMIVPYSLILSGLGAIFCGVIMICTSCMFCQHNAARRPAQGGQVFSDVPMTGYPQTQPYTQGPPSYGQPQDNKGYGYNYSNNSGLPPVERRRRRRQRRWWTRPWLSPERRCSFGLYDQLMTELRREDRQSFVHFLRMPTEMFDEILQVGPRIAKQNTFYRNPLEPGLKLAITLRHLASGAKYRSMQYG
ncbi:unnamed protein product [Mytilus edulis]|uniref:Uncharacterized protein n=1 Tax=Mytilus edulis TaxID=6550 RepID=A0A8S3RAZ7_MYTED|nr:unnamed protein product [Mytilus edulis]